MEVVYVFCYANGRMKLDTSQDIQEAKHAKAMFVVPRDDSQTLIRLLEVHIRQEFTNAAEAWRILAEYNALPRTRPLY